MFRTLLELGRVSNLPTVWTNLTAGWILGGGGLEIATLFTLFVGGSLLYLAGMALNDAAGADFDREHKADRPIVRGAISETATWGLGWGYLLTGFLLLHTATPAFGTHVTAIGSLILGYTFTHKHWGGCTYLMGGIRAVLYLLGAGAAFNAASGQLGTGPQLWLPLLWAVALGAYVICLTEVARGESTGAGPSPFPLVMVLLPLVALVAGHILTNTGPISIAVGLAIALAFLLWLRLAATRLSAGKIGPAVGTMLAGMCLMDALAVSPTQPYLALLLVAITPLLLLWQKFVAAT